MAQGPAMTAMFSPPMTTSPTRTRVSAGCIWRPTSLKGVFTLRMRATPGSRRSSCSPQPAFPRMATRSTSVGGNSRHSQRRLFSFINSSDLRPAGVPGSSSMIMSIVSFQGIK